MHTHPEATLHTRTGLNTNVRIHTRSNSTHTHALKYTYQLTDTHITHIHITYTHLHPKVLRPLNVDPQDLVAKEAKKAMDVISYQAISNCADLVNQPNGIETIAQILMGIDDPEILNAVIAQITQLPDGEGPNSLMAVLEKMRPETGPKKSTGGERDR